MTVFSAMFDTLYADPNIAKDAVYVPPGGGEGTPCRAVRSTLPDEQIVGYGAAGVIVGSDVFELRRTEVPDPAAEGRLTVGGIDYVIKGDPRAAADGRLWIVETYRAG